MGMIQKLDPRTWISTRVGNWVLNNLEPSNLIDPKQSTAVVPAANEQVAVIPEQAKDAEVVSGTFMPDIQITTSHNDALAHTERLRKTVESFNEDKQTLLEWLVVKFFTVLAYLLPILIAWVVGNAIGQVWAEKFDWGNPFSRVGFWVRRPEKRAEEVA